MNFDDLLRQAEQAAFRGQVQSIAQDIAIFEEAWDDGDFDTLCAIHEKAVHDRDLNDALEMVYDEIAERERREHPISEEEMQQAVKSIRHIIAQYTEEQGI